VAPSRLSHSEHVQLSAASVDVTACCISCMSMTHGHTIGRTYLERAFFGGLVLAREIIAVCEIPFEVSMKSSRRGDALSCLASPLSLRRRPPHPCSQDLVRIIPASTITYLSSPSPRPARCPFWLSMGLGSVLSAANVKNSYLVLGLIDLWISPRRRVRLALPRRRMFTYLGEFDDALILRQKS
jgi:hypothetical protein